MEDNPAMKPKNKNIHHGALCRFRYPVNEGWPAFEASKKNKVKHTAYFYPGVNHGFHKYNSRYDEKAATLSWTRTIDFF
jgi:dienelactone hydrolase